MILRVRRIFFEITTFPNSYVVTYNYMKDYKGNAHKCLMAKAVVEDEESQITPDKIKVTPRSNPPLFTPSIPCDEYIDAEDNYDDDDDDDIDDPMIAKLTNFMCSLKEKKLTMFCMLMEMVSKHTITIKELVTLITKEEHDSSNLEKVSKARV